VEQLAGPVQQVMDDNVEAAYVDEGYKSQDAAEKAAKHGIDPLVAKHTEAKKGFVLLPRRWVVERSFGWAARFRQLTRGSERLFATLAGMNYAAFVCPMLSKMVGSVAVRRTW
jgi:transposase